jgi:hypothetical protein
MVQSSNRRQLEERKELQRYKTLKVYGKRGVTGDYLFLHCYATLMVLEEAC